jgi:SAM-dependent methyltransferase
VQTALTDETYWDSVWSFTDGHSDTRPALVQADPTVRWRAENIGRHLGPGRRFLEIGVGGSPWPAHVARRHGAEAWGIDFSRAGLALAARAVTENQNLVHLIEGDVFDRDKLPANAFDVVYSGGFVEHFPTPQPVMKRIAELVTEDGFVVTAVPNLCGLNGALQKLVDVETFQRHVVISPTALDEAHALGGLVPIVPARYVGVIDVAAVNFSRLASKMPPLALRALQYTLAKARQAGILYDELSARNGGRWLAPMVGGVYARRVRG